LAAMGILQRRGMSSGRRLRTAALRHIRTLAPVHCSAAEHQAAGARTLQRRRTAIGTETPQRRRTSSGTGTQQRCRASIGAGTLQRRRTSSNRHQHSAVSQVVRQLARVRHKT
jgi:hypothetical protein